MNLNFQRIFDNALSKLSHFQKNFLDPRNFFDYISSYLPKLEYSQWVSPLTPDLKLPDLKNPTDVQDLTFRSQPNSEVFKALIGQYQLMINIM